MEELISRLKEKHGFTEEEAKKVSKTFSDFIKEQYPDAVGALGGLISFLDESGTYYSSEQVSSSPAASYIPDEALKNNQQLSKDKQSGFYEGNKKDY